MIDEVCPRKHFETENPWFDFEEARKVDEDFFKLKADTDNAFVQEGGNKKKVRVVKKKLVM